MESIKPLGRMSSDQLSSLLLSSKASKVAVIDVRDDDHVGGHIHSSTHVPSTTLDYRLPEIIRTLADKEIVVFHCALSQQRGPNAARRYMEERERKKKRGEIVMDAGEDGQETNSKDSNKHVAQEQEVWVLDKGFLGWQEKYF